MFNTIDINWLKLALKIKGVLNSVEVEKVGCVKGVGRLWWFIRLTSVEKM